jgi:hypothetical protein
LSTIKIHDVIYRCLQLSYMKNTLLFLSPEERTENLETRIYQIEDNIASTGGTILDMLQTIPGLNIDTEGNVKFRGSNKIGFYIDNKPSALLGAGRTATLKQIPASSIEKIEVITNPSAKKIHSGRV